MTVDFSRLRRASVIDLCLCFLVCGGIVILRDQLCRCSLRVPVCFQVFIEYAKVVTTRILHGIHRGVGMAEEIFSGKAVLGKDRDADAEGQADLSAADLDGMGGAANDLFGAAFNVSQGAEFGHHDDELVSAHSCDGVGFANGREQALPYGREKYVAVGMAKRIVDLLEKVDVYEEEGSLVVMVLRSENRLAKTLVEQRAIGEAGQVIVMRQKVDVIRAATVFGDIATGNGDSVAQADDLNIQPGVLDHVVLDEDFAGVGDSSADDFTIFVDEAGLDHEGPNLCEDFAVEGLAGHAEAALGIRVDVAECEVDDGAGRIGNAIKNVEVVEGRFSSGEESRVIG